MCIRDRLGTGQHLVSPALRTAQAVGQGAVDAQAQAVRLPADHRVEILGVGAGLIRFGKAA